MMIPFDIATTLTVRSTLGADALAEVIVYSNYSFDFPLGLIDNVLVRSFPSESSSVIENIDLQADILLTDLLLGRPAIWFRTRVISGGLNEGSSAFALAEPVISISDSFEFKDLFDVALLESDGFSQEFGDLLSNDPICTLDVDGNNSADALTDGLLFIRYLFGIRNESLIVDVVASDCANCLAAEIEPILEQCGNAGTSDIDGNGTLNALTDGLLIIRYLFGIRNDALIENSVGDGCSRCNAFEIETYLQGLIP